MHQVLFPTGYTTFPSENRSIILFALEKHAPHQQAGPQANLRQLQDHAASGDLAKTEVAGCYIYGEGGFKYEIL
jgi:hypothetical protein